MSSAATPQAQPPQQNMSIDQALATAYGHWKAGQANQAEMLCQKILAAWPGNADAMHLLGLMSHNWGNLDLAIEYMRKACQSPRSPAVYFSNLAEMCRQRGLHAEGETAARRAVALDAALVGGWNNLGIILQESGKLDEALLCLQRVVALKPDYAEAFNNLGNTFKKLGQLDKAQTCYARALELAPNYAEGHSNLSNLLKEFGRYDESLAAARKAVDINPRLADAYINAAAVETARLRHEDALRWLNALLTFAPTNGLALAAKAGALDKLDLHEEGLAVAKQAVMAAPDNGDVQNALGQALQALGHYDEALVVYDKATDLKSTIPEQGHLTKGALLMEINRADEARAAFAAAIAVNPRSAGAYFNAADMKKYTVDDPDIARMEDMLARNEVQSHSDRMALHFALGKAWLDAGNVERGFAALKEGNRMKRATIAYDAEATSGWMQSIAKSFPAEVFASAAGRGVASDKPIFIIGVPRSGTTLIEQIFAAHPDVHGAGELSALRRVVTRFAPQYPQAVAPDILARAGETYIAEIDALSKGRPHVVDKMPANFLYAGMIALAMPNARIIHIRRDPVDTCLSCYTKLFSAEQNFTYDLTELGQFYRAYEQLMDHWRQVLPADRFIEVDYEKIVADLETEARRLVDFCGLTWDDACLTFHESNRPIRTASVNQVRQPIYKHSVGRWKKYAPHLGPLLTALGTQDAKAN